MSSRLISLGTTELIGRIRGIRAWAIPIFPPLFGCVSNSPLTAMSIRAGRTRWRLLFHFWFIRGRIKRRPREGGSEQKTRNPNVEIRSRVYLHHRPLDRVRVGEFDALFWQFDEPGISGGGQSSGRDCGRAGD